MFKKKRWLFWLHLQTTTQTHATNPIHSTIAPPKYSHKPLVVHTSTIVRHQLPSNYSQQMTQTSSSFGCARHIHLQGAWYRFRGLKWKLKTVLEGKKSLRKSNMQHVEKQTCLMIIVNHVQRLKIMRETGSKTKNYLYTDDYESNTWLRLFPILLCIYVDWSAKSLTVPLQVWTRRKTMSGNGGWAKGKRWKSSVLQITFGSQKMLMANVKVIMSIIQKMWKSLITCKPSDCWTLMLRTDSNNIDHMPLFFMNT